jgi:hypothetical protein
VASSVVLYPELHVSQVGAPKAPVQGAHTERVADERLLRLRLLPYLDGARL